MPSRWYRRRTWARVILCLCGFAGWLLACGQPVSTPEPVTLVVTAPVDAVWLLEELADGFDQLSDGVTVEVSILDQQAGLDALRAGKAQMALAPWSATTPGPAWQAKAIGRDGLAVIVHPSNPIDQLGLLQLRDLFGGRMEEWTALSATSGARAFAGSYGTGGVVQPVVRGDSSAVRAAFDGLVMVDAMHSPRSVVAPSSQAVVDYVAEHQGAIGYVSMALISDRVKAVAVEGVALDTESVGSGRYPLSGEVWLVSRQAPSLAEKGLLSFVLGSRGQRIVGQRYGTVD